MKTDQLTDFGLAPLKQEGTYIRYLAMEEMSEDDYHLYVESLPEPKIKTTYVEAIVPVELEDAAYKVIEDFIKQNGYDLGEVYGRK